MTRVVARAPASEPRRNKPKDTPSPYSRTPRELREVLASPGHPIDLGLRRELESRLGHDFSRVRVHNDREAAEMTALLGADAVTVGQDIFFGRHMFRPEAPDGRRLLMHELLHTVQVPHPLGALVEGRDTGAVSLPGEPMEREAERVARADREVEPVERARQGAAWLRYATVNADQLRTEQLDPATLVDRLVAGVLRSLRGDPTDTSRRVRAQLSRFTPELRDRVLMMLERRLPSAEYARVLGFVEEAETELGPVETPNVPEPVEETEPREVEAPEPAPEKPEPETQEPEPEKPQPEEPAPEKPSPEEPTEEPSAEEPKKEPAPEDEEKKEEEAGKKKSDEKERKKEGEKPAGEQPPPAEETPAAQQPGAPGAQPAAGQGPPAGATPAPEGGAATPQPGAAAPEQVEAAALAPDSPLQQHGLLEQSENDERLEEQEKPIGLEASADAEVDVPEPEESTAEEEPQEPDLKPEDHLPSTDLDVSNVPTADRITLPTSGSPPPQQEAPSFPTPPPTKAEQLDEEIPSEAPEAPAPAPAAEQEEDEQPPAEQPLDAEVGPEPAPDAPVAATRPEPAAQDAETEVPETAVPGSAGPAGSAGPVGADTGPADPGAEQLEMAGERDPAAGVAPDASLEAGGGGCEGPPAPAEPEAAGAACGGGGGAAPPAEEQQQAPPPDVSNQQPEAALATVAALPPDKLQTSLSSVDAAVSNNVSQEQAALQSAPPTTTRPSGAPQTLAGAPETTPQGDPVQIKLAKAEATRADEQQKAEAKRVEGENQAQQAPRPHVTGNAQGQMSEQEVKNVQQAVNSVPTTDPALNTNVGPAPKVELSGEHDPARTDEQAGELQQASTTMHTDGRSEAAKNLGEHQIFPNAPAEPLTAQVPSAPGEGGGVPAPAGGTDQGVAVVAQQERGADIQAGVAQGQAQMGTERQTRQQSEAQAKANHEAEVTQAVQENSAAQAEERGKVATDAEAKRGEWRTEQDKKVEESNTEATKEHETSKTGIHKEKTDTDKKTEEKQQEDNGKIDHEREQAEEKARKEKEAKRKESEGGGFFSWLASKVTAFFEDLLNAITTIFNAAIAAVNTIIKAYASIVTGLIDLARKAVIGLINTLANALIRLCDVLAVFFPELAARMRKTIENLRDAAIAEVNKLADALKKGVEFLLNKLAEALTGLLRLLEKGLKAAVAAVRAAVNAAIEFAKSAIQMLGEFAAIIKDIAATGVGTWLGKMGTAAAEGIRNHLWDAIKLAVKKWFNEKVQAIIGLGKAVIDVLIKGCFSIAKIGKMVWDALIAALPMMIVMIVIERLVSLIVPAAGAVLAVVQGLMAAWGTISKILAAIGAFIAFVKAVRAGPAACLFATAVAAGVVALLEFITNFLMAKMAGAAKGVGNSLKGIAQKIIKGLSRAGKGARKAAGKAVNAARRGLQKAGSALRRKPGRPKPGRPRPARPAQPGRPARPGRPATAPSPKGRLNQAKTAVANGVKRVTGTLKKVGNKLANSKFGKSLKNAGKKLRDKYNKFRDKWKAKAKKRQDAKKKRDEQKNSPQAKRRRLEMIVARIKPKLERLLRRGVRGKVLTTVLTGFRIFYRLTALRLEGARDFVARAVLNPDLPAVLGTTLNIANIEVEVDRILRAVRKIGEEIEESGAARNAAREGKAARTQETTIPMASGGDRQAILAAQRASGGEIQSAIRRRKNQPGTKSDAIRLLADKLNPLTVIRNFRSRNRRQRQNPNPRNRLVDVTDPTTGQTKGVSYEEFKGILKNTGREQEIAKDSLGLLRGQSPRGQYQQLAADFNVWAIHTEGHRNIGALTTHAMALDMAARGQMSLQNVVDELPMAPGGAPTQAKHAVRYLNDVRRGPVRMDRVWVAKADELARREIQMIKLWVESLKNLKIKDAASAKEKETQLILEIRKRIHKMYGLGAGDTLTAKQFLQRVESEDVVL